MSTLIQSDMGASVRAFKASCFATHLIGKFRGIYLVCLIREYVKTQLL
jgi:hypothetical protein